MRYAVIHCRNVECGQHVWVPEQKLGSVGRCPDCGQILTTPEHVSLDDLIEGPHMLQGIEDPCPAVGAAE